MGLEKYAIWRETVRMNKELTPRLREFCERYLLTSNAAASARAAGYAKTTANSAYGLLRRPEVAAHLALRGQELINERVNPRRVLLELEAIAFADMADYAVVENGAVRVPDTSAFKRFGPWEAGPSPWGRPVQALKQGTRGPEVRMYDKLKALEILGRAMRMFERQAQDEMQDQASQLSQISQISLFGEEE